MRIIKLFLLITLVFTITDSFAQCNNSLIDSCRAKLGETIYLKHFKLRFAKAKKRGNPSMANFSVYLNKGTDYTFTIANDKTLKGEAIVKLYDDFRFFGSNEKKKSKDLAPAFKFLCSKTGIYYITIQYKDGEAGCSVVMLSMKPKKKKYDWDKMEKKAE
ncbi:MAG: hypothetical protein C0599_07285 [Salinivirgaceae bacterium]|nr:MAG: hypothetical protein C0599_07285 [Salinivirgaceae bacterium]